METDRLKKTEPTTTPETPQEAGTVQIRTRTLLGLVVALCVATLVAVAIGRDLYTASDAARYADELRAAVTVINSSDSASVLVNDQMVIQAFSQGMVELSGWSRESSVGFGPRFLIPPAMAASHRDAFYAFVKNHTTYAPGAVTRVSCPLLRHDGTELAVEINITVEKIRNRLFLRADFLEPSKITNVDGLALSSHPRK